MHAPRPDLSRAPSRSYPPEAARFEFTGGPSAVASRLRSEGVSECEGVSESEWAHPRVDSGGLFPSDKASTNRR